MHFNDFFPAIKISNCLADTLLKIRTRNWVEKWVLNCTHVFLSEKVLKRSIVFQTPRDFWQLFIRNFFECENDVTWHKCQTYLSKSLHSVTKHRQIAHVKLWLNIRCSARKFRITFISLKCFCAIQFPKLSKP